ncbi:MAG TPA: hypothetical protein GX528_09930 [Firmicutes bacterium]|nr:hypothetical protein [Bacillota bacterium]
MRNLYIRFETAAERESFLGGLLEIPKFEPRDGTGKMTKKQLKSKEEAEEYLALFAEGKTKSPWFNLYQDYYFAHIPAYELKRFTEAWHGPVAFKQALGRSMGRTLMPIGPAGG